MTSIGRIFLGTGKLKPELRAELERDGLVLIEEGLSGSIRYRKFRAPGRYKGRAVAGIRVGLALSEHRFVVYAGSGKRRLIDTPFTNPRLQVIEISAENGDTLAIHLDYDRLDEPKMSGEMTIRAKTPNAASIVEHIRARVRR